MIKFREHRGGLAESMETMRTFETVRELKEYLQLLFGWFTASKAYASPYAHDSDGGDHRIGWENVHIISSRGYGVLGFTNGFVELEEPKKNVGFPKGD